MPIAASLESKTVWLTRSNAFAASKNTACIEDLQSRLVCQSSRTLRSCYSVERPFKNPNCSSGKSPCSRQKAVSCSLTKCSSTFDNELSNAIGQYDDGRDASLPLLGTGVTTASFQAPGNVPASSERLNIKEMGLEICSAVSFSSAFVTPSGPQLFQFISVGASCLCLLERC